MHPGERPASVLEFRDALMQDTLEAQNVQATLARRDARASAVRRALRVHRAAVIGVLIMVMLALIVTLTAEPIRVQPLPTPAATVTSIAP
jgi:hypothetical protein